MKAVTIRRPWLWVAIAGALTLSIVFLGRGIVLLILGSPEYEFGTVAVYEAPESGYRIEIHARGLVRSGPKGSERSSATATVRPIHARGAQDISFEFLDFERARFMIDGAERGEIGRLASDAPEKLAGLLRRAGYGGLSLEELRETHAVINGVLSGPKATLLKGQTKTLTVVGVRFDP